MWIPSNFGLQILGCAVHCEWCGICCFPQASICPHVQVKYLHLSCGNCFSPASSPNNFRGLTLRSTHLEDGCMILVKPIPASVLCLLQLVQGWECDPSHTKGIQSHAFSWSPREGETFPSRMDVEWLTSQSCLRSWMQWERLCLWMGPQNHSTGLMVGEGPGHTTWMWALGPDTSKPTLNLSLVSINLFLSKNGLPWWLSGKEVVYQRNRHGFDAWVRKVPWKRKWQPTPVFLPGKFHEQRSLAGYSPWGHKRVRHDLATKQQQQSFNIILIYLTWVSMSSPWESKKSWHIKTNDSWDSLWHRVLTGRACLERTETLGEVISKGNCPGTLCLFLLCPRRGKFQNNQRRSSREHGS